jgi:DNA-binding transcriptional ArsR family regulator
MLNTSEFDSILRALADPTRRGLFERVAAADEIISQHLKALKQAGLVAERPEGRKVFYRANPQGLEPMIEWMTRYAVFWSQRLDALERLLRDDDARKTNPANGDEK